jgi:DNA-binding response OmpR family regulator
MSDVDDSSNQSFRTQLSNIRHDLRTPVGHILGYSEMLEEEFEDEEPWPEFQKDLNQIHSSGERMVEIIDELLGASKDSPEELDLPFTQHQLRIQLNHISGYYEMLRELAEDEDRPDVLSDLDRIGQASKNLVRIMEERLTPAAFVLLVDAPKGGEPGDEHVETPGEALPKAALAETAVLGEGGDILIVDDDAANRDLLQRRLQRQGYTIYTQVDGESALKFLETETVDLILLDMQMPGMNGTEVLQILKKHKTLRNTPVIMLSASDDMNTIVNSILMGAEDYLFKPYNPVLLKARISAALEKHRLRKQSAKRLKVFISSPGDVVPERRAAKRVLSQITEELSGQVHLIPILWEEEPLLASETPQSQIFPAKDTDIYIGIFWARMGTRLPEHIRRPDGSRYDSGSEYEFEDAMEGYRENGRPDILVYRKTAEPMVGLSDREQVLYMLDQKERLEEFFIQWFQAKDGVSYTGTYLAFETEDQFESMLYDHLRKLVMNRLAEIKA